MDTKQEKEAAREPGTDQGSQDKLGSNRGSEADLRSDRGSMADQESNRGSQANLGSNRGSKTDLRSDKGSETDQESNKGSVGDVRSNKGSESPELHLDSTTGSQILDSNTDEMYDDRDRERSEGPIEDQERSQEEGDDLHDTRSIQEDEEANQPPTQEHLDQDQQSLHDETHDQHESTPEQKPYSEHSVDERVKEDIRQIQDDRVQLNVRLETAKSWLDNENIVLNTTHFKDYRGIGNLKAMLAAGECVLEEYQSTMDNNYKNLNLLRETLTSLSDTVDKKLTNEGLISWLEGPRAHIADPVGQAEEKDQLSNAAQARAHISTVETSILRAERQTTTLEHDAARATEEASDAKKEAIEAVKAAEDARKAAEKKARADEEAARKAEEEKKLKEEAEQRARLEEEEQRRAQEPAGSPEEQERRRLEAERRDPTNWPTHVYSVDGGEINVPVGCVLRAIPGTMEMDDVTVTRQDQGACPVSLSDNEELVGHLIQITANRDIKPSEPLAVALPHVAPRNVPSREVVIKRLVGGGRWAEEETRDVTFNDIKDFRFVEVRLRAPTATLAVVTRPRRETLVVTRRGGKVVPSVDPRVCLVFRPSTYKTNTNIRVEIQPVDLPTVSDLRHRQPAVCEALLASSPLVHVSLPGNRLPKPLTVHIPVPPNPNKQRRPQTSAGDTRDKPSGKSGGSRPLSAMISAYQKEEVAEDSLYLLTPTTEDEWAVTSDIDLVQSKGKDIVTMEIDHPIKKFLILRVSTSASVSQVERIAASLDTFLKQRVVQLLLRQSTHDPATVTLLCVPLPRAERYQRKLAEDGYEHGPPPSDDIILREGQKMALHFRGNLEPSRTDLEFVYNSQIPTRLDFQVTVIDKFAQRCLDSFRGFARVFRKDFDPSVVSGIEDQATDSAKGDEPQAPQKEDLYCELLISIPKPEPESPKPLVKRAPVVLKCEDVLDSDYLRHLSGLIGEEWKVIAQTLGVRRMRIQAIMRNNVTRDGDVIIYEMLATWAKRIPRSMNKVDVLCNALANAGRSDLVEEIRDKEHELHLERRQMARVAYLNKACIKIAQSLPIINQWRRLGKGLGIRPGDLDDIDGDHPGIRDKVVTCLKTWRQAHDTADVTSLMRVLRKCRWGSIAADIQSTLGF